MQFLMNCYLDSQNGEKLIWGEIYFNIGFQRKCIFNQRSGGKEHLGWGREWCNLKREGG